MTTEKTALLVAVLALIVSIGVPILQSKSNTKRMIATKRTFLLQRILAAKSVTFVSMHELIFLLKKHGDAMEPEQKAGLEAMVPRMRVHHDELEKMHLAWSDFDDGKSLRDIEAELIEIDSACSEAEGTAMLIENGRRSYEGI